jgi:hypothetical protein
MGLAGSLPWPPGLWPRRLSYTGGVCEAGSGDGGGERADWRRASTSRRTLVVCQVREERGGCTMKG